VVVVQERFVVIGNVTGRPLFCMHPIGGHVTDYVALAKLVDEAVYAIPSRARREPAIEHTTMAAMAADYADVVQAAAPPPYRLFGYSLGGLIAHAVACELERRGAAVELVGLVDPPAGPSPEGDHRTPVMMAIQILHPAPPPRPIIRRELTALTEVGPDIAAWCVARNLLPADVPAIDFESAIALYSLHRALLVGHEPGVCAAPLRLWTPRAATHEWSRHTTAGCAHRAVGGDHFTIMRSPHVDAVAADLNSTRSALS
jgi:thioesterase domain-containing protein